MRLYVIDKEGRAIYLNRCYPTRKQLSESLGSRYFKIGGCSSVFNVNDVFAESGLITGGLIGFIASPVSNFVNTALGNERAAQHFNNSST